MFQYQDGPDQFELDGVRWEDVQKTNWDSLVRWSIFAKTPVRQIQEDGTVIREFYPSAQSRQT